MNDIGTINHNAGVLIYGLFHWQTRDQIKKQILVNILGTMDITEALSDYLIESKGRIINITSASDGVMSRDKQSLYKDYFEKFNQLAKENAGATGFDNYGESNLFADIDKAYILREPTEHHYCSFHEEQDRILFN